MRVDASFLIAAGACCIRFIDIKLSENLMQRALAAMFLKMPVCRQGLAGAALLSGVALGVGGEVGARSQPARAAEANRARRGSHFIAILLCHGDKA